MKHALTIIAVIASAIAFAATETVNGITWTYTVSNGEASIVNGTCLSAIPATTKGAITIPSSLGGFPVTSIGGYAFWECSGLTNVTIPDSVKSIGAGAFDGCSESLFDITTIPGVKLVDGWVIRNMESLSGYLDLTRASVRGIAACAFYDGRNGCYGLTGVALPAGITDIAKWMLWDCIGLTSVTIPDSVNSIGAGAFYCCTNLTSVTIPDSVTSIGSAAFSGCSSLSMIVFEGNAPIVAEAAFSHSNAFASSDAFSSTRFAPGIPDSCVVYVPRDSTGWGVDIPGTWNGLRIEYPPEPEWTITADGTLTTVKLNGVTDVTIPDGVTSIGNSAFRDYSGLTSVTIPDSVTSIGERAFEGCTSLVSVTMPNSITNIGKYAFNSCPGYEIPLARIAWGGGSAGGVQSGDLPYALTNSPADRAIALVTVNGDRTIDSFVLKDGKVYDSVLYINNISAKVVTLTLPSGYTYKAIKGAKPLLIPANSQSILSITRVADNVFLVSREDLETIE